MGYIDRKIEKKKKQGEKEEERSPRTIIHFISIISTVTTVVVGNPHTSHMDTLHPHPQSVNSPLLYNIGMWYLLHNCQDRSTYFSPCFDQVEWGRIMYVIESGKF
jgi:hypothetical protein